MKWIKRYFKNEKGFSTLITTLIVLFTATIVTLFTADAVINRQRVITTQFHIQQAMHAAEAGLNYGVTYLTENRESITDGQTLNGNLSDGSSYHLLFTFQAGNNLIQVKSTGTSADGLTTRTVQQLATYISEEISVPSPTLPVKLRGSLIMSGSSKIRNTENPNDVVAGGATYLFFRASTASTQYNSSPGNINGDINQGNNELAGMSDQSLQENTVGKKITDFQSEADLNYTNNNNYNYNTQLNGQTNKTIYISQTGGTANINGSTTIGTLNQPVTLVVNGPLTLSGNVVIYGNVYISGDLRLYDNVIVNGLVLAANSDTSLIMRDNSAINGAIVAGNSIVTMDSSIITYNSNILNQTNNNTQTVGEYAKIPGSWTDLNP